MLTCGPRPADSFQEVVLLPPPHTRFIRSALSVARPLLWHPPTPHPPPTYNAFLCFRLPRCRCCRCRCPEPRREARSRDCVYEVQGSSSSGVNSALRRAWRMMLTVTVTRWRILWPSRSTTARTRTSRVRSLSSLLLALSVSLSLVWSGLFARIHWQRAPGLRRTSLVFSPRPSRPPSPSHASVLEMYTRCRASGWCEGLGVVLFVPNWC